MKIDEVNYSYINENLSKLNINLSLLNEIDFSINSDITFFINEETSKFSNILILLLDHIQDIKILNNNISLNQSNIESLGLNESFDVIPKIKIYIFIINF